MIPLIPTVVIANVIIILLLKLFAVDLIKPAGLMTVPLYCRE